MKNASLANQETLSNQVSGVTQHRLQTEQKVMPNQGKSFTNSAQIKANQVKSCSRP